MSVLQYNSYELSTDKFKKLDCAMCLKNGDYIDALNFCVECQSYFCTPCLKNHLSSKSSNWLKQMQESRRREDITDILGNSKQAQPKRNDTDPIKFTSHRSNVKDTKSHPKIICDKLKNVLLKKKRDLNHLQTQADTMKAKMKDVQANIKELLEEFVVTTEQELVDKHQYLRLPIKKDIEKIEKALKHLKNNIGEKGDDKRWIETLLQNVTEANDENGNLKKPLNSKSFSELHKTLAVQIEDLTYKINKIGSFVTEDSCSTYLQIDKHNVKTLDDRTTCDINDMCQLDDGALLLCDWNNTNIKQLDQDLEVKNICQLPSIPWSICQTGPSEIAVSLFLQERIQFITITHSHMNLMSNFKVGEACRGIGCTNSNLVVSCGGGGIGESQGHLRVFNKSGDLLKVIMEDQSGHDMFSCPFHITIVENMIYTTDRDKGLVCLDLNLKNTVTTNNFCLLKGICKQDENNILICDFKTGTILQYNTLTMKSMVIVEQVDKMTGPQSLCYDQVNKILAVASGNSNVICTYQFIEANN